MDTFGFPTYHLALLFTAPMDIGYSPIWTWFSDYHGDGRHFTMVAGTLTPHGPMWVPGNEWGPGWVTRRSSAGCTVGMEPADIMFLTVYCRRENFKAQT